MGLHHPITCDEMQIIKLGTDIGIYYILMTGRLKKNNPREAATIK